MAGLLWLVTWMVPVGVMLLAALVLGSLADGAGLAGLTWLGILSGTVMAIGVGVAAEVQAALFRHPSPLLGGCASVRTAKAFVVLRCVLPPTSRTVMHLPPLGCPSVIVGGADAPVDEEVMGRAIERARRRRVTWFAGRLGGAWLFGCLFAVWAVWVRSAGVPQPLAGPATIFGGALILSVVNVTVNMRLLGAGARHQLGQAGWPLRLGTKLWLLPVDDGRG